MCACCPWAPCGSCLALGAAMPTRIRPPARLRYRSEELHSAEQERHGCADVVHFLLIERPPDARTRAAGRLARRDLIGWLHASGFASYSFAERSDTPARTATVMRDTPRDFRISWGDDTMTSTHGRQIRALWPAPDLATRGLPYAHR
jgi:hypothetical protein